MKPEEILTALRQRGVRLSAEGDLLRVETSGRMLPAALLAGILKHQVQLRGLLSDRRWEGQRVKLEDLADFKAMHGLETVASEWPRGKPCPVMYFTEA